MMMVGLVFNCLMNGSHMLMCTCTHNIRHALITSTCASSLPGVAVAGGAVPVVESTVQIRSAHIEQLCPHRWPAIQ